LQRGLLARVAVGTMGGGPTYVERATEGTGCLPTKLERAIDCIRLIAGRTARPSLGISVICERCLHRWLLSCSVAALWWGAEAIGLAGALRRGSLSRNGGHAIQAVESALAAMRYEFVRAKSNTGSLRLAGKPVILGRMT
jgi:hypothetical protein